MGKVVAGMGHVLNGGGREGRAYEMETQASERLGAATWKGGVGRWQVSRRG